MAVTAYIGLGGNMNDPEGHLARGLEELEALPQTRVTGRSRLYRSAPVGYLDQPDFVNAVARIQTELSPESLLVELLAIELRHGRRREFPNAPRTLDLDLLLYGNEILSTARLTIPHPRMGERGFVLLPLLELAPDIVIPGQGPARMLAERCRDQRVTPLDDA
jgi:2-amino-4-hydroxy-6-hydroxymethyldihydropteridine diphosphokinase